MSLKPFDLSLIIACFNEEKHLEESVREIENVLCNSKLSHEIIFIDDKSKDGTSEVIKQIVEKNKNYRTLYHKINLGRGRTIKDGILASGGKVAGYIDIDLEVSPVYIPYFAGLILNGRHDIVTGYRIYHSNIVFLHREIFSRGYSLLVKKLLKVPFNDTESGYKFFNRKKILPVLKKTKNNHWFWDTEIMALSFYNKLKIKEVPVLFTKRFDKKSTVNIFKDIPEYFINLLQFRRKVFPKYAEKN